jgi:hypothetical protein
MRPDWNPLESARDLVDFAKGMDQHRNTQETVAVRKLLEEQNRLQREANELEKKRQVQEKIGQAQSPASSTTAPYNNLSPEQRAQRTRNAQADREYKTAIENVVNERDTERRREMARKFEAKYSHSPFERPDPKNFMARFYRRTPSEQQQYDEERRRHFDELFEKDRLRRETEIKKTREEENKLITEWDKRMREEGVKRKAEKGLVAEQSSGSWWSFILSIFGGSRQ